MSAATAVTPGAGLRLGLADIADLANVRRPVVSMWRSRSAGTNLPFPAPVEVRNGQEWFDGPQVVSWLEATGRGNNPAAREDLAAFASLDGGSPAGDETVFLGLTALLCLYAIVGRPFGTDDADDVLDLADEVDPDDDLLFGEIAALQQRIGPLAHYCDLLVNAAFNPVAALERLMGERFRLHAPAQATVALNDAAHRLIGEAAVALAGAAGFESLTVVDPTVGGSDLLVAVAGRAGGRSLTVVTGRGGDPASRLARRRLRVHDIHRAPDLGSAEPGEQPADAVILARYPSPGRPDMSAREVLDAMTDVLLGTTERQRLLALAPAAVLTERLRDPRARVARDRLLRFPTLRAVVRLPAGLVVSRPRERLALMLFGRRHESQAGEQRLMVGDLSNVTLDAAAVDDLVTDLVASTAPAADARAHRARFLRPVIARRVLAWAGSIVEVASPAELRRPDGADLVLRVQGLAERIGRPLPSPVLPGVELSDASETPGGRTTLGAAKDRGELRIVAGLRLAVADGETGGGVRVLGEAELSGEARAGDRTVDRLGLVERHPQVQFTEPGDVVFGSARRPAALVDTDGGAVAVFPARVARIVDPGTSGLTPNLLAADINALPAQAKAWRSWPIRRAPHGQGTALNRTLAEIGTCRAALDQRRRDLDELAAILAQGAVDGALDLNPAAHEPTEGT